MMRLSAAATTIILILCVELSAVFCKYHKKSHTKIFRLSNKCSPLMVHIDDFEKVVEIESTDRSGKPRVVHAGSSCTAMFATNMPNHGLCVQMLNSHFYSKHAKMEFITTHISPDKIIQSSDPLEERWCTPRQRLSVRVSTSVNEYELDRDFTYKFAVSRVPLDEIPIFYHMDSWADCGQEYSLNANQEITLESERMPNVTSDLPMKCKLSFSTSSVDEYEQVCVKLNMGPVGAPQSLDPATDEYGSIQQEVLLSNSLQFEGLDSRYYSLKKALSGEVSCSENKQLHVVLVRNTSQPFRFHAKVSSRWHEYWQTEDREETELRGLNIIKGITYFVAAVDSLIGVLAATLSTMLKYPRGPWRRWAENFNAHAAAHAPQPAYQPKALSDYSPNDCKDDNSESSVSSPDFSLGAYPELPVEVPETSKDMRLETSNY